MDVRKALCVHGEGVVKSRGSATDSQIDDLFICTSPSCKVPPRPGRSWNHQPSASG